MNIGVILPAIENNQLSFDVVNSIEKQLKLGKHQYTLFYENITNTRILMDCSIQSVANVTKFEGLLVSTTLRNTELIMKLSGPLTKRFLIWDAEWIRDKRNFMHNLSILRNPNIELIARSSEISKLTSEYCNRTPLHVINNLDFEKML